MPSSFANFVPTVSDPSAEKAISLPTDEEFDRAFPAHIRKVSANHWSTVAACHQAAIWLVTSPGTRVLDIGCGPGKFCAIGAMSTAGHFTGVEQRKHLCRVATELLSHYGILGVQILHANVMQMEFRDFDAFYLFNPFEENLLPMLKINDEVPVYLELYARYIEFVRREFSRVRIGTRIVTYWGACDEIPSCYDCVETAIDGQLRLWVKCREADFSANFFREYATPSAQEFAIV